MTELTEREIFDCLETNMRLAIGHCEDLAKLPMKGPTYAALRNELKLIEGACRQACYWREDARWLPIGFMMNEAHQRAGNWLRAHMPSRFFMLLADNMRKAHAVVVMIRDAKTGRSGMILPEPIAVHRDTRPSRVILPEGLRA